MEELAPEKVASGSIVSLKMTKTSGVEMNLMLPVEATGHEAFLRKDKEENEGKGRKGKRKEWKRREGK